MSQTYYVCDVCGGLLRPGPNDTVVFCTRCHVRGHIPQRPVHGLLRFEVEDGDGES